MLHRMTGIDIAGREALLPATLRLLERILEARTYGDLGDLGSAALDGTASYGASPESNLPFARFRIVEADPALLALAGRGSPGFEVLQGCCGGFQFHWRTDLARALETEMPVLGRYVARRPREEALVVEHFVLPMLVRHRVRKLWGWLLLGREGATEADLARLRRTPAHRTCLVTASSADVRWPHGSNPATALRNGHASDIEERRQGHGG